MAFAGTASATTLDTSGGVLNTGTELDMSLKPKTSAVLEDTLGNVKKTFTKATLKATTSNQTGSAISANVVSLTFEEGTDPINVIANGSLSITWTRGRNGIVASSGTELTTEEPGGVGICVYGTGSGTTLGTLSGVASTPESATLEVNAVLSLIKTESGFCTTSQRWTAQYVITTPKGLTVSN